MSTVGKGGYDSKGFDDKMTDDRKSYFYPKPHIETMKVQTGKEKPKQLFIGNKALRG